MVKCLSLTWANSHYPTIRHQTGRDANWDFRKPERKLSAVELTEFGAAPSLEQSAVSFLQPMGEVQDKTGP